MSRLTKDEVIKQIVKASTEVGENPCTLIALAHIETGGTYNNMASNGSYQGVYQMENGYGGVKGNDRYNPYIATKGVIKVMRSKKEDIVESGVEWVDFYYYLSHQQGLWGAKSIGLGVKENLTIQQYCTKYKRPLKVIMNNSKKAWGLTVNSKLSEWVGNWHKTFEDLKDKCKYACPKPAGVTDTVITANTSTECGYVINGKMYNNPLDLTGMKFKNRNFFLG